MGDPPANRSVNDGNNSSMFGRLPFEINIGTIHSHRPA